MVEHAQSGRASWLILLIEDNGLEHPLEGRIYEKFAQLFLYVGLLDENKVILRAMADDDWLFSIFEKYLKLSSPEIGQDLFDQGGVDSPFPIGSLRNVLLALLLDHYHREILS